jgi:hypothetical protein
LHQYEVSLFKLSAFWRLVLPAVAPRKVFHYRRCSGKGLSSLDSEDDETFDVTSLYI